MSQAARGAGRISRAYFPSREGQLSPPGGNAFMFVRDVPLGIMPSRHDDGDFAVSLDPSDPVLQERIIVLLEIGQFSRYGLQEAVVNFVETLARDIAFSGECYFEVSDPEGSEGARTLLILPPGIIRRRGASYLQVIPEADRHEGEPAEIEIPAKRMWHITLPPALGSPKEHRKLLRDSNNSGCRSLASLWTRITSAPRLASTSPRVAARWMSQSSASRAAGERSRASSA